MTDPDDDFLSRWSRRKAGAGAVDQAAPAGDPENRDAREVPEEADIVAQLPDVESLDAESDFSAFMKQGVPSALRRQALRKLWKINPVFSVLDGMNEYDEDYTIATSLAEGVKTIYQVGKGMVRPEEEKTVEAEAEEGAAEPEPLEPEPLEPDRGEAADPERSVSEEPADTRGDEGDDGADPVMAAPAPAQATDRPDDGDRQGAPGQRTVGRSAAQRRWGAFRS